MIKGFEQIQFIDIHYHANPDLYTRRLNGIEAGLQYKKHQGACVLKSHLGATSIQSSLANAQGLAVFPSLTLNAIAGGINYRVILQALAEYSPQSTKLIVDFPTITGRKHHSKLQRTLTNEKLKKTTLQAETLFNDKKRLKPQVLDILKMQLDYPIVVSTGHASKEEVYALVDACIQHHIPSLLLNQPANPLSGFSAKELETLCHNEFIWFEQTILTYLLAYQNFEDISYVLNHIPRVIYSSDLGQKSQMTIDSWLDYSDKLFQAIKLPRSRKKQLIYDNPRKLIAR
jgi:Family of unknown function (DUF6282)